MNTDTCPSVCQHIHTPRRAHKASSLLVTAFPPAAAKIVSFLLSLKRLIKMLRERSFQSSPDAAFPHWDTIYLCKSFTAWHISASGFIYYWVLLLNALLVAISALREQPEPTTYQLNAGFIRFNWSIHGLLNFVRSVLLQYFHTLSPCNRHSKVYISQLVLDFYSSLLLMKRKESGMTCHHLL